MEFYFDSACLEKGDVLALGFVGVNHWPDLAAQETARITVAGTLLGVVAAALAASKLGLSPPLVLVDIVVVFCS